MIISILNSVKKLICGVHLTKNLLQKEYQGSSKATYMVDPPEGVRANDAPANAFLKVYKIIL